MEQTSDVRDDVPMTGQRTETETPISRAELAGWIGVGIRTVDRMVERGELPKPCLGKGGRPRWLRSYVEQFLRKQHERNEELDRRTKQKLG